MEDSKSIEGQLQNASWSRRMFQEGTRRGISPRLQAGQSRRRASGGVTGGAGARAIANRILGSINAPALWHPVEREALEARIDARVYREKRDLLCDAPERMRYDVRRPEGTFHVFLKTQVEEDASLSFARLLAKHGVPGSKI
jgi:hypothetical protein